MFLVLCWAILLTASAHGQRLAILTPDNTPKDIAYAEELSARFPSSVRVIDRDQSDAAFRSVTLGNPFNMTSIEARSVAAVIGCDAFVVVHSSVLRRSALSRPTFFEAYAVHYLVDGRTGELAAWKLKTFENEVEQKAANELLVSISHTALELSSAYPKRPAINDESVQIETVPDEGTPAAANLKTPIPYKRIKPAYTSMAFLYDVKATVEIEVDVGESGGILATRIVRWAGYGLDESVDSTVRAMNWRPAMRGGKPLPMRVLLRYNFTKVDKD
ncbi:MAG TPA: energy transducer TonB [Pyrinomonadaceae bacterium]|nr:energy transducer TonB [Pyrinomonadaceae bacterium]